MSLAHGRPYLAIPGPSSMPDRVLAAMHRAAPNIYEGDIVDMTAGLLADLRRVALSTSHAAIYISNGHGAWEAAIANMFSRGDKALVLATGRFGIGWATHARAMGVEVEVIDFGLNTPADPARLEAALRADTGHSIKAVLVTHIDTATSILNDIPAMRAAMDAAGHPALLAVDCIASLGCNEFRMDDWGVDVMVSASQKGLMVPPGLGFVWVSDKAVAACRGSDLATPYWNWEKRIFADYYYEHFAGTAPTHHLFGLRESLTMILDEEGLPQVWARHKALAGAVWAAFDTWGLGGDLALNIADPARGPYGPCERPYDAGRSGRDGGRDAGACHPARAGGHCGGGFGRGTGLQIGLIPGAAGLTVGRAFPAIPPSRRSRPLGP